MNTDRRHAEFIHLFSQNARRLHGYIYALLPNWADADDVFQDVSQFLWEKYDGFQSGTDFFAWACRIAHFKILAFRQKQSRTRITFSEEFIQTVAQAAEADAELLEAQYRALTECVENLPSAERRLLLQRYGAATTTRELASCLNRSPEALYKSLQRIRLRLVKCLERKLKAEGFETELGSA